MSCDDAHTAETQGLQAGTASGVCPKPVGLIKDTSP